jgi:homoserine kinase type II
MSVPLDAAARQVLAHYPFALREGTLVALGNGGGFSGARLWRLEGPFGPLCLRAWPPGDPSLQRLQFIHRLMTRARQAGLHYVPMPLVAQDGATWIEHAGRLWELTSWLPGRADYRDHPSPARLEAACAELARLHQAWANAIPPASAPCPAVERRLEHARAWQQRLASGWRPPNEKGADDPLRPWAERAWHLLAWWSGTVPSMLKPWVGRPLPLQPCLCDVWHDHILYDGERVSGLIDFGGVKVDHVSVDLARLLGSLVGDDGTGWECGCKAYATVRPLAPEEEALARVLDRTGAIVGAMTWLRWLYLEGREIEDRAAAARRLAALVERMAAWSRK